MPWLSRCALGSRGELTFKLSQVPLWAWKPCYLVLVPIVMLLKDVPRAVFASVWN